MVAVTPWLAPRAPDIRDDTLREILRNHRGRFAGRPAICWYEGIVPPELQHIGSIPPTEDELAIDPQGAHCGAWSVAVAHDVLRERGVPVEHVAPRLTSDAVDRVAGVMSENEFWSAIALLDWTRPTDEEAVAPLLSHLAQSPVTTIAGFHRKLCEKLFELDREAIAREIGEHAFEKSEHFSADHFLDARCAAVGQGSDFYQAVLSDPQNMVRDREFEILATLAEEAYRKKTGRAVVFLGTQPIETFSNRQGWSGV